MGIKLALVLGGGEDSLGRESSAVLPIVEIFGFEAQTAPTTRIE